MDQRKEHLSQRLQAARAELLALVGDLEPGQAQQLTSNPGWTIQDVVAHLASAERGHRRIIQALLAGQPTDQPDFDLDTFNQREVEARRSLAWAELLARLDTERASTMAVLGAVGPDDWERAGRHPGGFDTTVEGTFRVIAIHERRHLKDIRAALQP